VTLISVDTNFPDDSVTTMSGIAKRMLILNAAVSAAVAAHPTYILLPEDSRYLDSVYGGATASSLLGQFMFTHGTTTSVLIDSYRAETREGQAYVRAIMLDAVHKQVYQFDKQYLVPQGEYVPYVYAGVLRAFGFGALVDGIEKDSAYVPGPLTRKVVSVPKNIPAVLFCSESVRPDGVTALLRDANAPFVVHPMSHGWFHHPTELWHELDQMLRIHARVAGVPIVSAGNKVDGKLYLPNGQIDSGVVVGSGDGWVLRKFTF
jgi:apolipoprotein N-acyltransferase